MAAARPCSGRNRSRPRRGASALESKRLLPRAKIARAHARSSRVRAPRRCRRAGAEISPSEMLQDRFQAVVPARGAARRGCAAAQRERGVVKHRQDLRRRDFVETADGRDGLAAEVHEAARLAQKHAVRGRDLGVPFCLAAKRRTVSRCEQRSRIIKPTLWRVFSYSRPGFPRPTMRRKGG